LKAFWTARSPGRWPVPRCRRRCPRSERKGWMTPAPFRGYLVDEVARLGRLVKKTGAKLDW